MSANPPVVLVHGMWSRFETWGETPRVLDRAGWAVLRYELPGHGARYVDDPSLGRLGIAHYVDDLLAFIARQERAPILIGHSMGALVALLAAQRLYAEGKTLPGVLMVTPAAAAGGFPFSPSNTLFFLRPLLMQCLGLRPFRPTQREAAFGLFNCVPPQEREALAADLQKESARPLLQIAYWPFDPRRTTRLVSGLVGCPVRIFLAEKDRLIPSYFARAMRRRLRDVEISTAPAVGHMVFLEPRRPAFFAWLTSHLSALGQTDKPQGA